MAVTRLEVARFAFQVGQLAEVGQVGDLLFNIQGEGVASDIA
jgi:hypothetical protein